jgi:ankyrin repeat protein
MAATLGRADCVKVLIAAGADVKAKNYAGHTALYSASTSSFRTDQNAAAFDAIIAALKAAGATD